MEAASETQLEEEVQKTLIKGTNEQIGRVNWKKLKGEKKSRDKN